MCECVRERPCVHRRCVSICAGVRHCAGCLRVRWLRLGGDWETTQTGFTGFTGGGRGVSRQPAGYPITLRLPLRPLCHDSSQQEVGGGQAGPSPCHYASITCRPLCADNRTFSSLSSTFTLGSSFSFSLALSPFFFFV